MTTRLTPAALEFVAFGDMKVGDTLVYFTPVNKNVDIPATQRQLDRIAGKQDRFYTIESISHPRDGIVEFGTGPGRVTSLTTAKMWRIKR